jgi:hypothetical protein
MAHQQRDAVIFGLRTWRQSRGFFRRNAEPVHAGVDVQRRAAAPVLLGDERIPFGEFSRAVDHRSRRHVDETGAVFGDEAAEDVNCGVARARAQPARFAQIGHKECLAAGLNELGRNLFEPEPIAVGLDDRAAFDGANLAT